jgi:hypothetical protein
MSDLRFTGRLPTEAAMRQFPNWEFALEEEGLPDQDETTLRPGEDQSVIDWDTACTAAIATTPNGTELMVILRGDGMSMHSEVSGVDGLHVLRGGRTYEVELFPGAWRPEEGTTEPLRFFDPEMVPLRITSVLPAAGGREERHEMVLMPDGVLLVDDEARGASFEYPGWFRPSDLSPGDRSHLLRRTRSKVYKTTEGKREILGSSERTVARHGNGTLRFTVDAEQGNVTLRTEVVFDEGSLEARAVTSTLNGTTRTYAPDGTGAGHLPPNVFGDEEMVPQCAPLTEGWRVMFPVLLPVSARLQNCILTVEGREPAPDHPGSTAWRVLIEPGTQMHHRIWIDTTTRRLLSSRITVPGMDLEHGEIFEPEG